MEIEKRIRCVVCEGINDNRGNAVLEATLILPLFIFAMIAIYMIGQCNLAKGMVYEAAAETAEYIAEFDYLYEGNVVLAKAKFADYVDDQYLVDKYVKDGINGVHFYRSDFKNNDNQVMLRCDYKVEIALPFIPKLSSLVSFEIVQNAYVGDGTGKENTKLDDGEEYVYITDNKDVYHSTRGCSHLALSISQVSIEYAKKCGYIPCDFCGNSCGDKVIVCDSGGKYHSNSSCSGLKRSVYRVKKSEVSYLGGCSRCVK